MRKKSCLLSYHKILLVKYDNTQVIFSDRMDLPKAKFTKICAVQVMLVNKKLIGSGWSA